ncbi:MAG TPA: helix-turn-helix transcriptional regulator [Streptosporangiaceae bacterium]|nr:helix-turn-helix transcriptional regulator [Streptosporangiaceae bacterium]
MTLKSLLVDRGYPLDAAALLAGVDRCTIWRMANGKSRARPATVVRLAKALGVSARRLQALCDETYAAAHPDEVLDEEPGATARECAAALAAAHESWAAADAEMGA